MLVWRCVWSDKTRVELLFINIHILSIPTQSEVFECADIERQSSAIAPCEQPLGPSRRILHELNGHKLQLHWGLKAHNHKAVSLA